MVNGQNAMLLVVEAFKDEGEQSKLQPLRVVYHVVEALLKLEIVTHNNAQVRLVTFVRQNVLIVHKNSC